MRQLIPLTAMLALAACGSDDKTTTVTTANGDEIKITSDADNNNESGTITFEGKDGEGKITFGDAAAKEGLPLGLPVYPGGEVKGAFMGGGGKGETGGMATVMTKAAPAAVVDFYKAEAEKRGFTVKTRSTSTTEKGEMASFSAKGADGGTLVVTATPAEDGGTAAVIIGGGKN
jgi:hypothetical protein